MLSRNVNTHSWQKQSTYLASDFFRDIYISLSGLHILTFPRKVNVLEHLTRIEELGMVAGGGNDNGGDDGDDDNND